VNVGRFGPLLTSRGVTFRLWAPAVREAELLLDGADLAGYPLPMQAHDDGWFSLPVTDAGAGTRYRFRIDGEREIPDPASQFQPEGLAGPSEVVDHGGYRWHDGAWLGRPWSETVTMEVHVGALTPQGSFQAMTERLDHFVALGVTAIELMPVAAGPGARNWGYDGVLWYAPSHHYGRPDDLKALIDAAHQRGLMVFLDAVYNHFGPEGNDLRRLAPAFFSNKQTLWGDAIDYRIAEARAFAIENALHWLHHYRFDGLRLDAVHAITEPGEIPMLHDLAGAVDRLAADSGRHIHLVLENDDNAAHLLAPAGAPPDGKFRAQWNDDYHHAWHVLLTGEHNDYYQDYADHPLRHIARTLAAGFAYQGEVSAHRDQKPRGEPTAGLSPLAFVNFLQNHDQIGNRPLGERLDTLASIEAVEAALAVTLLAPTPPLMFMGEEWGATQPFPYFCDYHGELADAVRRGRRREFASAYAALGDEVPDPLAAETFQMATLDWSARDTPQARDRLALVTRLLDIRRRIVVPRLPGAQFGHSRASDDGVLTAQWIMADATRLNLLANLSDAPAPYELTTATRNLVWGAPAEGPLRPWSVHWWIGER
jgi:malto-oligosyltrehalose trehalohydrolase